MVLVVPLRGRVGVVVVGGGGGGGGPTWRGRRCVRSTCSRSVTTSASAASAFDSRPWMRTPRPVLRSRNRRSTTHSARPGSTYCHAPVACHSAATKNAPAPALRNKMNTPGVRKMSRARASSPAPSKTAHETMTTSGMDQLAGS